jgi:hypothetical protein
VSKIDPENFLRRSSSILKLNASEFFFFRTVLMIQAFRFWHLNAGALFSTLEQST